METTSETSGASFTRHADLLPDFLAIGHVTRDLLPDGGWRLGGTVTYAALTALRLGLRPAIVTSAPPDLLAALDAVLPDIPLSSIPAPEATTFENIYTPGGRQQFLRSHAAPLTLAAVPAAWRNTPIVLLGPVAQEVDASLAMAFPQALVAATPQGWLRQWSGTGLVSPTSLVHADLLLPHVHALILSREDVPPSADALVGQWAKVVPLIAVTYGAEGVLLLGTDMAAPVMFAGYPAREIDPTGAGDVFAAAFLCELHRTGSALEAVDFANRVAACSVEATGGESIPTREMLAARWGIPGSPD